MVSLFAYLGVSVILFIIGIIVMISRKNLVAILLGIELILNAAALNFVAYSRFVTNNLDGHVFSLFIIVVTAAEAAVGLAIVIRYFQLKGTIHVDEASELHS